MQTLEELISLGYQQGNADQMLKHAMGRIGEVHGCNKVTDITYTENHERDVELTCTLCGKVSHKMFTPGRNKWSELKHSCECQSPQKFPKIQKGSSVKNDDPSFLHKTFGDYEVIGFGYREHKNKSGGTVIWDVVCVHCGKTLNDKLPSEIKREKPCGCLDAEKRKRAQAELWESRIGERYGKLKIEGFMFRKFGGRNKAYANCICDCGNKHTAQYSALKAGQTKSCGCMAEENRTGRTKSLLYSTWMGMRHRCNNPKSTAYKDYGGRGIKVCDEWNDNDTGLAAFEEWAWENGYAPDRELTLDRIDVNGNYEPSNCRYVNTYIQTVNRRKPKPRKKKLIEVDGQLKTKQEWCEEYNISVPAVDYRMNTLNMPFELALKLPKSRKGNIFAGEQAKRRSKELNKCESYIEANLYLAFIRVGGDLRLDPQVKIDKYRVDFVVKGTNIVVECDGYDNHKTKEQIMHDNERDRFLQREGYVVLRFSGTEINNDPDRCAIEIVESVNAICGEQNENRKTNAG